MKETAISHLFMGPELALITPVSCTNLCIPKETEIRGHSRRTGMTADNLTVKESELSNLFWTKPACMLLLSLRQGQT